jgi:hypothetical protein
VPPVRPVQTPGGQGGCGLAGAGSAPGVGTGAGTGAAGAIVWIVGAGTVAAVVPVAPDAAADVLAGPWPLLSSLTSNSLARI